MKQFLRKKFLLLLVSVFFTSSAVAAISSEWPLYDVDPVLTHWRSWSSSFLAINDNSLFKYNLNTQHPERKPQKKLLRQFSSKPDLFKHFPLDGGDLLILGFNNDKKLQILAYDSSGDEIYSSDYRIKYPLVAVDVRIDSNGNPVAVLHSKQNNNHVISLWIDGDSTDIINSEQPVKQTFLQWNKKTIHILSEHDEQLNWLIYREKKYIRYQIPVYIVNVRFFSWMGAMYLVGIDAEGNLWRYSISPTGLRSRVLLKDNRLRYVDEVIPTRLNRKFNLVIPGSKKNTILRLQYRDFVANELENPLEERAVFWAKRIVPVFLNRKIYVLSQTELGHLYLEPWDNPNPHLYNVNWQVNTSRATPFLEISWNTGPRGKQLSYSYLLDHKHNSQPLDEKRMVAGNSMRFDNPEDGSYTFHIQVHDINTQVKSPLYHIPIFWKYVPETPEIILIDEIAPRMIKPGPVKFFISNLDLMNYYAEINSIPKYTPRKLIGNAENEINIDDDLKPGRYYLHLRGRHKRSGVYSPTLHYLFFMDPYNPEQDSTLDKNTKQLGELQYLLKRIRESRGNPEQTKRYLEKLKELRETID